MLGVKTEIDFEQVHDDPLALSRLSTTYVLGQPNDFTYFAYPQTRSLDRIPPTPAFEVVPGERYLIEGKLDAELNSQMSLFVIFYSPDERLGQERTILAPGDFELFFVAPEKATGVSIALRVGGAATFELKRIEAHHVTQQRGYDAGHKASVAMLVLNDIANDNRVIKTAQTLVSHGYEVVLFGMERTAGYRMSARRIAGMQAYLYPNPGKFLRDTKVRSLRWEHTVAYMKASMWAQIEECKPRFLHTHDCNTTAIGLEFTRRLCAGGHRVHWIHDFHEWVEGFDNIDPEWQSVILRDEAEAIAHMDQRFTVSASIAQHLARQYELSSEPEVVLNAPKLSVRDSDFAPSVRGDLGLAAAIPLIVYTGGVSPMRGIHTVVTALSRNESWHLALVTNDSGGYVEELKSGATAGGYESRLHFLPYVEADQVPRYVRDATVGVHPMVRYGNSIVAMPNKLFDYLFASIPVVVSNCDLMGEFVRRWGIGEVFEAENVEDCASKLGMAIADRERYRAGIRAQSDLVRSCSWDEQSQKIVQAYERLTQEQETD